MLSRQHAAGARLRLSLQCVFPAQPVLKACQSVLESSGMYVPLSTPMQWSNEVALNHTYPLLWNDTWCCWTATHHPPPLEKRYKYSRDREGGWLIIYSRSYWILCKVNIVSNDVCWKLAYNKTFGDNIWKEVWETVEEAFLFSVHVYNLVSSTL